MKTTHKKRKDRGMIALMSTIIISAILLLLATSLSFTGLYSRFNILNSESKERSSALADACIDIAILELTQNSLYSGNINSTIGENICYIGPVTTSGSQKIFKTRGIFSNSYTNLKVVVDDTTFVVISVEEVPTF